MAEIFLDFVKISFTAIDELRLPLLIKLVSSELFFLGGVDE